MIRHIFSGMEAYSGTLNLISKLKLWKYFFIPIAISIITATLIFVAAYGFSDNIGRFIAQIWVWEWGKETFTSISTFIGAIVVLALGIIVYKHIILALSAPFMGPVSEKIEAHLSGIERDQANKTSFQALLWRGIRINMRNLVKELLVSIPILMLKFIPVVNIFSFALLFLVQAYYAGFGNMDYTLERHFKYKDSVRFVGRYRGIAIGNGIIFILFTLIPLLGWVLVLPFSVTAATSSTVRLLQKEEKIGISNIQVI